jgi:hypothetical protein
MRDDFSRRTTALQVKEGGDVHAEEISPRSTSG